jgi:hypothetical protein
MKYLLVILLLLLSCESTVDKTSNTIKHANTTTTTYSIITIDSCEYIKGYYRLTHKGNCSNSIHCYN